MQLGLVGGLPPAGLLLCPRGSLDPQSRNWPRFLPLVLAGLSPLGPLTPPWALAAPWTETCSHICPPRPPPAAPSAPLASSPLLGLDLLGAPSQLRGAQHGFLQSFELQRKSVEDWKQGDACLGLAVLWETPVFLICFSNQEQEVLKYSAVMHSGGLGALQGWAGRTGSPFPSGHTRQREDLAPHHQSGVSGLWAVNPSRTLGRACRMAIETTPPARLRALNPLGQVLGLYVLGLSVREKAFNESLLKPFAFQLFAYMILEISSF